MAETQHGGEGSDAPTSDDDQRIHPMQSLLDNPFLLLFIGVAVPAVLYTIWGVMEVAQIPIGR